MVSGHNIIQIVCGGARRSMDSQLEDPTVFLPIPAVRKFTNLFWEFVPLRVRVLYGSASAKYRLHNNVALNVSVIPSVYSLMFGVMCSQPGST